MKGFRPSSLAILLLVGSLPACGGAPAGGSAPAPAQAVPPSPSPLEAPEEGAAAVEASSVPKPPPLTPLGVPECDRFLEKYLACVDLHVPDDQKEGLLRELHTHRTRWLELEKMQAGKVAAGLSCRGVAQRMKGDLIVDYGCEF